MPGFRQKTMVGLVVYIVLALKYCMVSMSLSMVESPNSTMAQEDVFSTLVVKLLKSKVHIERLKGSQLVKNCSVRCTRINKNEEQMASIKTCNVTCIPDSPEQNLIVDLNLKRKIAEKIKKPKKAPPRTKPTRHSTRLHPDTPRHPIDLNVRRKIGEKKKKPKKEKWIIEYKEETSEEVVSSIKEEIIIDDMEIVKEECLEEYEEEQELPIIITHTESLEEGYSGIMLGNVQGNYQGEWDINEYEYLDNLEQLHEYITGTGRPSRENKLPTKYNDFIMCGYE